MSERIAAAYPGVLGKGTPSVVSVRTTRPVLLVFGEDDRYPACVAQRCSTSEVLATHETLRRIRQHGGALVAEPLGYLDDAPGTSWSVVKGLPGWPWFALPYRFSGRAGFESVADVAVRTLEQFRSAVSAVDEWRTPIYPRASLDRELRRGLSTYPELAGVLRLETRERWLRALEPLESEVRPVQHGDFCLNNLLLDESRAYVLDFEEFGLVSVPLHDEFSLAFSLREFGGRLGVEIPFEHAVRLCTQHAPHNGLGDSDLQGALLAHHLCWRLNQCVSRPTRAQIALQLRNWLTALARNGSVEGSV